MNNNQYILKLWLPAIVIVGLLLFLVIASVVFNVTALQYGLLPGVGALIFAGGVYFFAKRNVSNKLAALLQQPEVEPFYDWYDRQFRRLPDNAPMLALSKGIIATYYGDFARARGELGAVDWNALVPLYQAQGLLLQALLDYFQLQNYESGYRRAVKARELAHIDLNVPGKVASERAFKVYVDAGNVMRGRGTAETINSLVEAKQQLPLLGKLAAAWALEHAYRKNGDTVKADEMRGFLTTNAPYCKALLST